MDRYHHHIRLTTETKTVEFANDMAPRLARGDTILLSGPIGAGKSTFARALIRARLGDANTDVPSPTFTLVQTYDHQDGDIWHCDLYRLTSQEEVFDLGLDEAFQTEICLIEWPEKLGDLIPSGALHLQFKANQQYHQVTCDGPLPWVQRLDGLHG